MTPEQFEAQLKQERKTIVLKNVDCGNDTFYVWKDTPDGKAYIDDKEQDYAMCVLLADNEIVLRMENLSRPKAFANCFKQMMHDLIDLDDFQTVYKEMEAY